MSTQTINTRIPQYLTDAIYFASAVQSKKARKKELLSIRWGLRAGDGRFAVLRGLVCALGEQAEAQVFTGCDNERLKLAFWQAQLGCALVIAPL